MRGFCTINVDASFDHKIKKGSFACLIVSDDLIIKAASSFREPCLDSNEAEIKGLINSLHLLIKSRFNPTTVVINCDNSTVRGIVSQKIKVNKKYEHLASYITQQMECFITCYPKIIKGHQHGKNGRQRCNNWCDAKAKEVLRKGTTYYEEIDKLCS
jgi:ribonuclease HI